MDTHAIRKPAGCPQSASVPVRPVARRAAIALLIALVCGACGSPLRAEDGKDPWRLNGGEQLGDSPALEGASPPLMDGRAPRFTPDEIQNSENAQQPLALTSQQSQDFQLIEESRSPVGGMRPIGSIGVDIRPPTPDDLPVNVAETTLNPERLQVYYGVAPFRRSLSLYPLTRTAAFCHQPLYFEEVNLERYGTTRGRLQPAVSAARFSYGCRNCPTAWLWIALAFATITNTRLNRVEPRRGKASCCR